MALPAIHTGRIGISVTPSAFHDACAPFAPDPAVDGAARGAAAASVLVRVPRVSVLAPAAREVGGVAAPFAVYHICVRVGADETAVLRRWSQFHRLVEALGGGSAAAGFPWWLHVRRSLAEGFLEARRAFIETYLVRLLATTLADARTAPACLLAFAGLAARDDGSVGAAASDPFLLDDRPSPEGSPSALRQLRADGLVPHSSEASPPKIAAGGASAPAASAAAGATAGAAGVVAGGIAGAFAFFSSSAASCTSPMQQRVLSPFNTRAADRGAQASDAPVAQPYAPRSSNAAAAAAAITQPQQLPQLPPMASCNTALDALVLPELPTASAAGALGAAAPRRCPSPDAAPSAAALAARAGAASAEPGQPQQQPLALSRGASGGAAAACEGPGASSTTSLPVAIPSLRASPTRQPNRILNLDGALPAGPALGLRPMPAIAAGGGPAIPDPAARGGPDAALLEAAVLAARRSSDDRDVAGVGAHGGGGGGGLLGAAVAAATAQAAQPTAAGAMAAALVPYAATDDDERLLEDDDDENSDDDGSGDTSDDDSASAELARFVDASSAARSDADARFEQFSLDAAHEEEALSAGGLVRARSHTVAALPSLPLDGLDGLDGALGGGAAHRAQPHASGVGGGGGSNGGLARSRALNRRDRTAAAAAGGVLRARAMTTAAVLKAPVHLRAPELRPSPPPPDLPPMDLLELPDSSPSASTLVLGQSPQRTTGRGGRSGARALAQLMPSPPRSTLAEPSASRFGPPAFDRSTGSFLLGGAAANCSASPPLVALLGPHALAAAASAAASASASAVGCLRNDDARGGVRDYGLSVSPPSPALPWAQHQGAVARPTATALSVPASGCARVAHSLGGKPIGDAAFTQTAKSSLHLTAAAPKRRHGEPSGTCRASASLSVADGGGFAASALGGRRRTPISVPTSSAPRATFVGFVKGEIASGAAARPAPTASPVEQ